MINKIALFLILIIFNYSVFADVKDDISKINELNESGILSEQDFKSLLEKSIVKTEEYKKIKGLFDVEIISLEEFENFKNKIIIKYTSGATLDKTSSDTDSSQAAKDAADKAAKDAADKAAKDAADKAQVTKDAADEAAKDAADKAQVAKDAADEAAKDAADKAQLAKDVANAVDAGVDVIRKKIGKVLKVKKGKGFGDGIKLKKKEAVETGIVYTTLAGGDLHLMLDLKTRIFIGYESEIIIRKFDIVDDKVHDVEIELISGSFSYLSLRKTSTDLKVLIDDNVVISKGVETNVGFIKKENEIRFVNAGKSALKYKDELLSLSQYAVLDSVSKSFAVNTIANKKGDALIGDALEDFSMTVMGIPAASSGGSGGDGSGAGSAAGGGCG